MDDLDHSIHISEYDWSSFYEESEECVLLQPSLACHDDSGLSDSDDSGNLGTVPGTSKQIPDAKTCRSDCICGDEEEGGTECIKLVTQLNQSETDRQDVVEDGAAEICLHVKIVEDIAEETSVTNAIQTVHLESSGEAEDRNVQTESDLESTREPDPLSSSQLGVNVRELPATEGEESEAVSAAARVEKERWFVTVNDNLARRPERARIVKKKRRQKKASDGSCNSSSNQEISNQNEREINEEKTESEEGEYIQSGQNLLDETERHPSHVVNYGSSQEPLASDLFQVSKTSVEGDYLSEKQLVAGSPKEKSLDTLINENKSRAGSLLFSSQDTFPPPHLEPTESDEFDDCAEFLSIHSYDSESYLSAEELLEENPGPTGEDQQLHSSLFETSDSGLFSLPENVRTEDRQLPSFESVLPSNVAATNSKGYESSSAEPSLTFPSAGETASKMPADISTCNNDTHSMMLCMTPDTSGAPKHKLSDGSQEKKLSSLPVPNLTVTPCSAADCPETFAQAAGHVRPVYAISAFWDEMEKLTINDILQLRLGRSTPIRDRQEPVPSDDPPTNPGTPVDTVENRLSDSPLMDTSDTADSDYFTQIDESKPDRSSCEFSTSDFEEEYWQFIGTSRNTSPDPHSKKQETDSLSVSQEEESTGSEGKETPVPAEDSASQWNDHQGCNTLTELVQPRQLMKSKSMRNVQALSTDSLSLLSLLGNDDKGLFPTRNQSIEENIVLGGEDQLRSPSPASSLSDTDLLDAPYRIAFPEEFEYFFTEDTASQCVKLYDPDAISVNPILDYTLCTFSDGMSFSSLQCSTDKPIPIFSCSHPTVRDLTFPKPHIFLSSNYEGVDNISPITVVSQSFIQASQQGPCNWKNLLSIRKVRFHDKGSLWCGRSGAWTFPGKAEKISISDEDPVVKVLSGGEVCPTTSQQFREVKEHQRIVETFQTEQEGIFSTLKQSDMCLVCIAFASWVMKSSDPDAADAWKAALLANVSALSAIQYLRHYAKKKKTPQEEL